MEPHAFLNPTSKKKEKGIAEQVDWSKEDCYLFMKIDSLSLPFSLSIDDVYMDFYVQVTVKVDLS